ncbi:TonB-dependent receptor [Pseudopedobacter saltans DSM 12145]|uniref:TonB-dependent receptor n=1 Tax=Pseudopedobacter saltans (strain ATCC 51119 / DSM 12145 / JCM 21818 / CCUG 39354 / LMG 10337 / NBRC 100064 / NCIMB 13643) TaxID=762903 RepID=F0SAX5_PSESL|nr:TonB-dependent receptor [Pseudopedobacter saltans]ADY51570.1 TonB-dependent receptor [Pseudopedobacter saltans DSM 12145]
MLRILISLFLLTGFQVFAQQTAYISGVVKDAEGNRLNEALVFVQNTKHLTKTNTKGEYTLVLPTGKHQVSFSYIGYRTLNIAITLKSGDKLTRDIIFEANQLLSEVRVIDQKDRREGITILDAKSFEQFPNASQSFEAMLKQLPGVSTNNELSSQYSVRGGNFDENLIYINDIEIFKPYLVRNGQQEGLSLINPDLVKHVKFSAGGFSPRYGDRMSSVLDIQYKSKDSLTAIASLATNGSSLTLFGEKKHLSFALAYRNKKNQSLLKKQQVTGSYNPNFNDLQAILNYQFNKKFNVDLLGIYNKSEFGLVPESRETVFGTLQETYRLKVDYEGQEKDAYENTLGALSLNYKFNPAISLKWINSIFSIKEKEHFDIYGQYVFEEIESDYMGGSYGQVKANRGFGAYQDYGRNELNANIYSSEFKLNYIKEKSVWEAGLKYQRDEFRDKLNEFNFLDSAGYSLPNSNGNGLEVYDYRYAVNKIDINRISGYLMNANDLGDKWSYTGGLRFIYNTFTKEFIPSPRLILTFHPKNDKDILYRFATGLYVQSPFYREMRDLDGSINYNIKSQKSIHLVASSDYKFEGLGTQLRFISELYYKKLKDLVPYELENLRIRYLANQRSNGYAVGLDFSLSGEFVRDLQSSFRLSIMKTEEDIENDGIGYIKRPTDQRVNFSSFFQDRLFNSPTYKVHLNILYGSKLPAWPPKTQNYASNFNIPAYKRVDIGFSKDLLDSESEKRIRLLDNYFKSFTLYAEVFNLLNINNTVSYLWISDINNNRYAIPNYLTSRQLNFKIIAKF